MKPHLLSPAALSAPAPLAFARDPRIIGGFFPAQRRLKGPARAAIPAGAVSRAVNVVNNLRLTNHILVRISLARRGAARASAPPSPGSPAAAGFAREAIDQALRREMDRELTLMERGENIASNQRRRAMLGRYLSSKPYHIIQNFYAVQMQALSAERAAGDGGPPPFYSDLVTERGVTVNRTVYEQHAVREPAVAPDSGALPPRDAQKIADQVLDRLERRMRLQKDRYGFR